MKLYLQSCGYPSVVPRSNRISLSINLVNLPESNRMMVSSGNNSPSNSDERFVPLNWSYRFSQK